MESLVNKKVRLRNRSTGTHIVANDDQRSVTHVRLDDKSKSESSVWVIKSTNPDNSVYLESMYGTMLSWSISKGTSVFQKGRPLRPPKDEKTSKKAEDHKRWTVEEVEKKFTSVQIRVFGDHGIYLYPDGESPQLKLRKAKDFRWSSWLEQPEFYWDIEIVDASIQPQHQQQQRHQQPEINDKPNNTSAIITKPTNTTYTPVHSYHAGYSASYTYQVTQMHVHNVYHNNKPGGTPTTFYPFANYANTGNNTNVSGTQIIGGVKVQTRIDSMVNNSIVQSGG